jgi:hypothetical protein
LGSEVRIRECLERTLGVNDPQATDQKLIADVLALMGGRNGRGRAIAARPRTACFWPGAAFGEKCQKAIGHLLEFS